MAEDEIFKQVLGPERHGRVRRYGLGPTPSSIFGSSLSRSQLLNMLETTNKRNKMMQSMLDDMRKENKEERKRNEEERRRNEEERKKMEKKYEELRALIEGRLLPSSSLSELFIKIFLLYFNNYD
ncbi:Ptta/En/Spm family transposase ['Planchonia careya' phytoplasma]|nr:hypothetical protein ['Planchonia careya' phytoplasma]MDO8030378.1 Ptta/En/Spm family transposase ['Planchonia careya' phytoplasma]